MSRKSIILFIMGIVCTIIQFCLTKFTANLEVLSVVICSIGILCFILFLIDVNRKRTAK
jgi:uncharacterized protein with PQ loop repeat